MNGISKERVVLPVLTPERAEKRQNGRRFKENGEEAFTLTAQDIHGVAISVSGNVVSESDGIAHCLNANDQRKIFGANQERTMVGECIDNSSRCICIQGQRIVENRKFEVDKEGLLKELRLRKKEKGISNQEIADSLGIPLTQVEHYFRQDDYWAVPDPELWDDFKKLLGITTTEFDESIMTFEQSIGKYEKGDRFYDVEGLSPTLNCGADINALMKVEKTKQQLMTTDEVIPSEHDMGHIVEIYPGVFVYAIWYEKYQCYIAIRKLLPIECFKLQGWSKDYFEKAEFVNSDSQLFKQAGNGVTVNVVYEIAKRLD